MFKLLNHEKSRGGFTLIEVLVAMFIALVGFVGLYQMFSFGYFRLKSVKNRFSAVHYCQRQMEKILSISSHDAIRSFYSSFSPQEVIIDFGSDLNSDSDDLKGTRTVQLENWTEGSDYVGQKITVTVTWHYRGKDLSESLVSAVSTEHQG